MKYRILGLLGVMALTAGSLQAQDYDDIYYDASKAQPTTKTKVKVEKPAKTVAVYGDVPERYKLVVKDNYREERDVDEYNRRGAYEPKYEVDINGDTIYFDGDSVMYDDDMFASWTSMATLSMRMLLPTPAASSVSTIPTSLS